MHSLPLTECDTGGRSNARQLTLCVFTRETLFKLERHEKLAREGKDLYAALSFANFVLSSGHRSHPESFFAGHPREDRWRAPSVAGGGTTTHGS
jgi:hypothetical protein